MKDLLLQVCPLVGFFFAETGVSATTANAEKNKNTNQNQNWMRDFQEVELYETEITLLTDKGINTHTIPIRKLSLADFDKWKKVAHNNGINALLGNGIKIFNKAMEQIKTMDATQLVAFSGEDISLPAMPRMPERLYAVGNGTVDSVVQLERVEDILDRCTQVVLGRLDPVLIKKALILESEAATFGNELQKKDAFLQRLLSAKTTMMPTETVSHFAIYIKKPILAYSPAEMEAFKTLFDDLQKRYQSLQGQLNGIKRTIKDTIRMAEIEFASQYDNDLRTYSLQERARQDKINQIAAKGEVLRGRLVKELLQLKIQTV
jgi:hypothetical protein